MKRFFVSAVSVVLAMVLSINYALVQPVYVQAEEDSANVSTEEEEIEEVEDEVVEEQLVDVAEEKTTETEIKEEVEENEVKELPRPTISVVNQLPHERYNWEYSLSQPFTILLETTVDDAKICYKLSKYSKSEGKYILDREAEYEDDGIFVKDAGVYSIDAWLELGDYKSEIEKAKFYFDEVEEEEPYGFSLEDGENYWIGYGDGEQHFYDDSVKFLYTGKAITIPNIKVYHGKELLEVNKDYTISYKNNVKVQKYDSEKAPQVIITGKGGYSGKIVHTFSIVEPHKRSEPIKLTNKNARIKVYKNDVYDNGPDVDPYVEVQYKQDGEWEEVNWNCRDILFERNKNNYKITVIFYGDYTGTLSTTYTMPMYDLGKAIKEGKLLLPNIYDDEYTAFSDTSQIEERFKTLSCEYGNELICGKHYLYSLKTSKRNDGGANLKITLKGINRVKGSYTYNIKLAPIPMGFNEVFACANNTPKPFNYDDGVKSPIYNGKKNNYKPVAYTCWSQEEKKILKNGTDYTESFFLNEYESDGVTYKKVQNNVVYPAGTEMIMRLTGKGLYDGYLDVEYTIASPDDQLQSINNQSYTVTAADITCTNKANSCKPTITVFDNMKGKKLSNKEYKIDHYEYVYKTDVTHKVKKEITTETKRAGATVDVKNDIIPAGTYLKAVVTIPVLGKDFYFEDTFRCGNSIAKTTVTVKDQIFISKSENVIPAKTDVSVMLGKEKVPSKYFEIEKVEKNDKVGTATLTIRGKGKYIGTKKVKFKIKAKAF